MAGQILYGFRGNVPKRSKWLLDVVWRGRPRPRSARYHDQLRSRPITYSRLTPVTQITLFRLVWPDAMVTEERGTFKSFAKNSTQALFARPSIGGVASDTFSASPNSPVSAFFFARGYTLTANETPPRLSSILIMAQLGLAILLDVENECKRSGVITQILSRSLVSHVFRNFPFGNLFCEEASKLAAELQHPPSSLTEWRGVGGMGRRGICPSLGNVSSSP